MNQSHVMMLVVVAMISSIGHSNAQDAAVSFDWIALQRTQCDGICPAYSVQIGSDGSVSYYGIINVPRRGRRDTRASADQVASLVATLRTTGFYSIPESWCPRNSAVPAIAGAAGVKISVRQGAYEKTIFNDGCGAAPEIDQRISALAKAIDGVADRALTESGQ